MTKLSVIQNGPDVEIVGLLTELLERAQSGRMTAFAAVFVDRDELGRCYKGDAISLNYALDNLKQRLLDGEEEA